MVLQRGRAEQQLNAFRREPQPKTNNRVSSANSNNKRNTCGRSTWRYQVVVRTAVRSEDLHPGQRRHRAGLDHQFY